MNMLKNRTVLGTICICIALVICFVIAPLFNTAASSMVDVVRIKNNIKIGQQINNSDIEIVKVGYHDFIDTAQNIDDVIGRYAAYDLFAGEFLMLSKTSETPANENVYLYGLTGEKQAVSITVSSFAAGLSGKLMSGDIVSVIAPDFMETGETVIPDELQFIEVIAVTHNSGYDVNEDGFSNIKSELEPDGNEERKLPSTITVLVRPEQLRLLAQLENDGDLHVSLVYRGNINKAKEFIDEQDKILDEKYPKENKLISDSDGVLKEETEQIDVENSADILSIFDFINPKTEGDNE